MHQVNHSVVKEPYMQCKDETNKYIERQAESKIQDNFWIIEDKIKYKEKGYTQEMYLPVLYPFH